LVKLPRGAGVGGSGCDLVNRPKQTVGEGPVEDSNHGPAFVRHGLGHLRGSGFCWFAVGHAASQDSVVLRARMWFSICRRYALERSALRRVLGLVVGDVEHVRPEVRGEHRRDPARGARRHGEGGREEGGGPEPEALRADDQLADRSPGPLPRAASDTWPGRASPSKRVNGARTVLVTRSFASGRAALWVATVIRARSPGRSARPSRGSRRASMWRTRLRRTRTRR
jgi:hypothetical protein